MKQEIILYLVKHPYARQREIAGALNVWTADKDLLDAMRALEGSGVIGRRLHKDLANMEYYDEWFVF